MTLRRDKKAIFLDLDGTIIDHESYTIPESTIFAIKKAQENGHLVVIATGRPPSLFYGLPEKLGLTSIIAANGRYVEHEGQVLHEDIIDPELIQRFVDYVSQENIDVAFISSEGYAMPEKHGNLADKFSQKFNLEIPAIIPDFHKKHKVLQMVMFHDDDFSEIEKQFPELDFTVSCEYGIDVNYKKGLKDIGVDKIVEHLNIPMENTIAMGDGNNDITMIRKVAVGVAMGNAYPALKEAADHVTGNVHEDGLYQAFKKYGLLERE